MANAHEMSIHVVSVNLNVLPEGLPQPNHNYISIRDHTGQELLAIHGFAVDREIGDIVASGGESDTLRAFMLPHKFSKKLMESFPVEAEKEIWRGSNVEGNQKLLSGLDAMVFFNKQNLVYHKVGLEAGQNSNSIAHSIVKAMGLEFPTEIANLWAPGHDRILLPENWTSYYARGLLDPKQAEQAYAGLLTHELDFGNILKQVKQDPVPEDPDGKFFDPKNPETPYTAAGTQHIKASTVPPDVKIEVSPLPPPKA